MAKTKFEEMMERLPSHIKGSDVLREESKKVLAALLELLLHSKARESKIIYVNNGMLRKLSGINADSLLEAIRQLEDYKLITRKVGTARTDPYTKGMASEYTIHFDNLKKPLKELSFDELFSDFFCEADTSGDPNNTTITNTITNTTTTAIATAIASSNTNTNTISTSTTREIPKIEINKIDIHETPTLNGGVSEKKELVKTREIPMKESPNQEELFNSLKEKYFLQIEEETKNMKYGELAAYMLHLQSTVPQYSLGLTDETYQRMQKAIKFKIEKIKKQIVDKMLQEAEAHERERQRSEKDELPF